MTRGNVCAMIGAINEYLSNVQAAMSLVRVAEIEAACQMLADARRNGSGVYICGNGGSAATASHFAVDLGKNLPLDTRSRLRVVSLTDNVPWLTAIANDQSYSDCFAAQLRNYLQPGDLVIGISASGDSENVVRAFQLARRIGASRLALIGFDGGRLASLATRCVWIDSHDYGVVESLHLVVVHSIITALALPPQTDQDDARKCVKEGVRHADDIPMHFDHGASIVSAVRGST